MNKRLAEPTDDESPHEAIEITFGMPVYLWEEDYRRLDDLLTEIVNRPVNQLQDGVHWVSGHGNKMVWSQADCRMLGRKPAPGAPESGEPTWIPEIYAIETSARGFVSQEERVRTNERRQRESTKTDPPAD